ncbi:hypothetical protein AMETH_3299 [Amycolatopsis methanolica 239]|uniref:Uncharacterized protein n=1 Tax=Amycolatopsis methanolica 239 TaxID=1068978 RepID=A0A076MWE3_AMYME|nr:hypothetical protein AMETH_3299 [Amycolatopsis methanolica 239]
MREASVSAVGCCAPGPPPDIVNNLGAPGEEELTALLRDLRGSIHIDTDAAATPDVPSHGRWHARVRIPGLGLPSARLASRFVESG